MKYDWKTAKEKWEKAEEHVQGSGKSQITYRVWVLL